MAKIMVVDDSPDNLKTMCDILENEGHEVKCVKSARESLRFLKEEKFDLVLIDILMPGISGYELKSVIKKDFENEIKIAYVSIVPMKEVDMEGVKGFIQKPFNNNIFIEKVNMML